MKACLLLLTLLLSSANARLGTNSCEPHALLTMGGRCVCKPGYVGDASVRCLPQCVKPFDTHPVKSPSFACESGKSLCTDLGNMGTGCAPILADSACDCDGAKNESCVEVGVAFGGQQCECQEGYGRRSADQPCVRVCFNTMGINPCGPNSVCVDNAQVGYSCQFLGPSAICPFGCGPHAICVNGKCDCEDGFLRTNPFLPCVRDLSYGNSFQ